ncbi:RNA-directed DNA polymerase, eukaryota [Tanacetum coccineum]|uniref:RNA-directed DNA polymerase, eukaryota n=1 Tax=Tanacetum coccineum TaxID=301880 RepID=A0ABQ5EP08_9ASTR
MAPVNTMDEPQLFLEQHELGVTGTIILMFCQMWDVYAATGSYLSNDFVVCDSKGSTMHATAQNTIAHNFMKLKEGGIYSVKKFAVQPNKDEFRVLKNATFMLELDGSTSIQKVFVKPDGFIRFPFEMVDFEHLETTNNKYLIDAAGYLSLSTRTACRLYLSSTSSTLILDDEEIPEIKQLKSDTSGAEFNKELLPVGCSDAKAETLENLLMWSRNRKHDTMSGPRMAGIFHLAEAKNAGKVLPVQTAAFFVNPATKMWITQYRLELEVSDDTAEVVVVMFNETASSLVKCTADLIVEYEDQGDHHSPLPQALANIVGTSHTLKFKSHTYYEHNTYESFTCWRIVTAEGMDESGGSSMAGGSRASETPEFKRLLRHPSVTTPSKVNEAKKQNRGEAAESDDEASFVADTQPASGVGGSLPDRRKHKRRVVDDNRQKASDMKLLCFSQRTNTAENQSLANILQHSVRIQSNTVIRQDGIVQSYCGLQLKGIGASISSTSRIPSHNRTNVYQQAIASTSNYPFSDAHRRKTGAERERVNKGSRSVNPSFSLCCKEGKIQLPKFNPTPQPLHNLLNYNDPATARFRDQIRVYNGMFSFTSFGARIDHSINNGRGVYTFRVNGQSYHRIGSLLPKEGTQPRYAQLWFFDTENEVSNRMRAFIDTDNRDGVDAATVHTLTQMLDQYSSVAKSFRMARNWCHSHASVNVELHLLSDRTNARQYNKPTVVEVAALITNDFGDGIPSRDIIVNKLHSGPKRISELHPAYMALQYPLLFPYGEDGFHEKIPYYTNNRRRKTNRGFVTMKEYYSYIIHQRNDQGNTLVRGGRLFQQYLVDAYSAVEEQRLKWTRNNQDTLRVDLYHNVCDAVTRGDTNTAGLGQRIVLPETFIGGPRYMMQNYQDAMALCRTYGNRDLFITFTSNPKWPEISEMLTYIPGQKAHDRPEIRTRVFKMKLIDLLHDLTKK